MCWKGAVPLSRVEGSFRAHPMNLCTRLLLTVSFFFLFLFIYLFLLYRATPATYGGSQAKGQISCQPTPQPQKHRICKLHRQHRILNPLNEASMEPAISWFLAGFVSTAPQRELLTVTFIIKQKLWHIPELFKSC